jgi:hypothetical protein
MTLNREHGIVARHAAAVVHDAQEPAPARFNINRDSMRTRINRILDQLLSHRRRALHHFTSGDLVSQVI